MKQTLILAATTHADAKEIMQILEADRTLLTALKPKGDRKLQMTGLKVQIDSMAETLEGIFTTARIEGYEITIENASEAVENADEVEQINRELKTRRIKDPMDRLKWLASNRPHMTVSTAAKIIGA